MELIGMMYLEVWKTSTICILTVLKLHLNCLVVNILTETNFLESGWTIRWEIKDLLKNGCFFLPKTQRNNCFHLIVKFCTDLFFEDHLVPFTQTYFWYHKILKMPNVFSQICTKFVVYYIRKHIITIASMYLCICTLLFHYFQSVGPKQLCALPHLGGAHEAGNS